MIRLEERIGVKHDYKQAYVKNGRVVAALHDFYNDKKFHYHVLDENGNVEKEFGRKYWHEAPKTLFKNFNPVSTEGDFNLLSLIGGIVALPLHLVYDTITYPDYKKYTQDLAKRTDCLIKSYDMCMADDAWYAIDDTHQYGFRKGHNSTHIAVFDKNGNGIKKYDIRAVLKANARDPRPSCIRAFEDKLIITTGAFDQSIHEFDKQGNYVRKLADDFYTFHQYTDVGKKGIYGLERGRKLDDRYSKVFRISWDSKKKDFFVSDRINWVHGLAVGENGKVYLRDENRILTYDHDMNFISEQIVEGLPTIEDYHNHFCCNESMVYDNGHLYLSARDTSIEGGQDCIFKLSVN